MPQCPMDVGLPRSDNVAVPRATRQRTPEEPTRVTVFGRYRGYLVENGVESQSVAPNCAALRPYVHTWSWQVAPLYYRTGNPMADKVTEMMNQFRCPPHMMVDSGGGEIRGGDVLTAETARAWWQPSGEQGGAHA